MVVEIDGDWSAEKMATFLFDIDSLYRVQFRLQRIAAERKESLGDKSWEDYSDEFEEFLPWYSQRPYWARRYWWALHQRGLGFRLFDTSEQLKVHSIRYGSPGDLIVTGIGNVVAPLVNYVYYLTTLFTERKKRKLNLEEQKEDIIAKKINNARNYIRLAEEVGLPRSVQRRLFEDVLDRGERIEGLVLNGNLKGVRRLPHKKSESDK